MNYTQLHSTYKCVLFVFKNMFVQKNSKFWIQMYFYNF